MGALHGRQLHRQHTSHTVDQLLLPAAPGCLTSCAMPGCAERLQPRLSGGPAEALLSRCACRALLLSSALDRQQPTAVHKSYGCCVLQHRLRLKRGITAAPAAVTLCRCGPSAQILPPMLLSDLLLYTPQGLNFLPRKECRIASPALGTSVPASTEPRHLKLQSPARDRDTMPCTCLTEVLLLYVGTSALLTTPQSTRQPAHSSTLVLPPSKALRKIAQLF